MASSVGLCSFAVLLVPAFARRCRNGITKGAEEEFTYVLYVQQSFRFWAAAQQRSTLKLTHQGRGLNALKNLSGNYGCSYSFFSGFTFASIVGWMPIPYIIIEYSSLVANQVLSPLTTKRYLWHQLTNKLPPGPPIISRKVVVDARRRAATVRAALSKTLPLPL